jgi:methylmalonyl-CoA/ethylmalonyl-CoA epimerase
MGETDERHEHADGERRDLDVSFDHAGIATEDADEVATSYEQLLGTPRVHEEQFDGMYVVFLSVGDAYLELLEPRAGGPVARYLDREGPGMHHLAVAVDDVERALARARDLGVEPIDETGRPGAWGHTVAFLHPRDTGGVLFEFVDHGD